MFSQSVDATWILDQNGVIIRVNRAAISLLRFSKEEAIGKLITDPSLWPPEMIEIIRSAIKKGKVSGLAIFEVSVDISGNGMTRQEGQVRKVQSELESDFLVFSLKDITIPFLKGEDAGLIGALNSLFDQGEELSAIIEAVFLKLRNHFGFSQETYWQLSHDQERLIPCPVTALVDSDVSPQTR